MCTLVSLCVAVSLGTVKGLPPFEVGESIGEEGETPAVWAVEQAFSVMALLSTQAESGAAMKAPKCDWEKVWAA